MLAPAYTAGLVYESLSTRDQCGSSSTATSSMTVERSATIGTSKIYRDTEPVHCTYIITADIREMMSNSIHHDLATEIIPSPAAEIFVDSVQQVDRDVALV